MNCQYCNNPVPPGVYNCPSCGAQVQMQQQPQMPPQMQQPQMQPQMQQPVNPKSVALAGILSCLIVGVGQMYNGQVAKGIVFLLVSIVVGSLTAGIGSTVLWILAIIDARKIAAKINNGYVVGPWEF